MNDSMETVSFRDISTNWCLKEIIEHISELKACMGSNYMGSLDWDEEVGMKSH